MIMGMDGAHGERSGVQLFRSLHRSAGLLVKDTRFPLSQLALAVRACCSTGLFWISFECFPFVQFLHVFKLVESP